MSYKGFKMRDEMIDFLKTRPDVTLDYIEYMIDCVKKRAQMAFERGMSLNQFEEQILNSTEELEKKGYNMPLTTKAEKKAVKHPNKLGSGAVKRKGLPAKSKIKTVMHEFKKGTLHSGSGEIVTNPKQGIAIALSEARKSKKKK